METLNTSDILHLYLTPSVVEDILYFGSLFQVLFEYLGFLYIIIYISSTTTASLWAGGGGGFATGASATVVPFGTFYEKIKQT